MLCFVSLIQAEIRSAKTATKPQDRDKLALGLKLMYIYMSKCQKLAPLIQ